MSSPGKQELVSTFTEGFVELRIRKTLLVTADAFC